MFWSRIADGRLRPVRVEGNHGRVSYAAEGQSHSLPGTACSQRFNRTTEVVMKKILCVPAVLFFFAACVGSGRPGAPVSRQSAVVQAGRTYTLGKVPDQEREQAFQDLLEKAHAGALKNYDGAAEIGFSYSLAPKGAVYTFSEVEVSCLIKKADASSGKKLCADFFKAVDAGLKNIVKDE